jgi:isoamylase
LGSYRLFFIFNADWRLRDVLLPVLPAGMTWRRVVDTSLPSGEDFASPGEEVLLAPSDRYLANARSTVLLLGL